MQLLCRRALTEGLQQPEESLDCHVHNGLRNFLARGQVYDMRHVAHRAIDAAGAADASLADLYAIGLRHRAVVTQRPDTRRAPLVGREHALDESAPDLSVGPGNEKLQR